MFETGQGCNCYAFFELSSDETSVSLGRFQYKWLFTAPDAMSDIEFDITWCERFIPTLSAPVTYMGTMYPAGHADPDPSHWTYIDKMWHYADTGDDNSDVFEVTEPSSNGTTDICCMRCCVTDWPGFKDAAPDGDDDDMDDTLPDLPVCEDATCP